MSELDLAKREFEVFSTFLAYEGFERAIAPDEQRKLDDLMDRVVELDAPDFLALAGIPKAA